MRNALKVGFFEVVLPVLLQHLLNSCPQEGHSPRIVRAVDDDVVVIVVDVELPRDAPARIHLCRKRMEE